MEMVCVEVTKERYKRMIIDRVILDTRRLWPSGWAGRDVCLGIQQDDAPPHITATNPA